ncbi:hypothetical protein NTHiID1_00530 [Haemophilus influenzae]|nr:hypothetical protein CHBNIII6_15370 [Haemophilus influenzae]GBK72662.1 hypothetical protein NTHiID1_00530 [Haemophilus influenzae]
MRLINTNVKMGNKGECTFFIVKTTKQRHIRRIKLKKDRLYVYQLLFDTTKALKCGKFSHSFT